MRTNLIFITFDRLRTIGIFARQRRQSRPIRLLITVDLACFLKIQRTGRLTNRIAVAVNKPRQTSHGDSIIFNVY